MSKNSGILKRAGVAIGILAVFFGVIRILYNLDAPASNGSLSKVTLAASKNPWTSLALVADHNGYFEEEGLDLSIAFQDGGRFALDALVSNSADFATIVEVNVSYLGFTGNTNVAVVGTIVESTSTGIIARRSAGISKSTDLRGKTLAYSPGTGSELFALRFLEANGITPEEVNMRKMQPRAIQGAIIAKEVDAACTWDPFVENARRALGDDAISFFDSDVYLGYMHIAARKEWAENNREEVSAFLRAVKRAADYIASNPAAAQEIVAEKAAMDLDLVESIWPLFSFDLTMDPENGEDTARGVAELIRKNNPDFGEKPMPNYSIYFDEQYYLETF